MKNNISKALEVLRAGGLILYPTDTIWGIGCDATNEEAVRKVFALKQRSDSKSLVLLASEATMIADYIEEMPLMAEQLIEVNDAPMTIIYPGAHVRTNDAQRGCYLAPSCVAEDGTVGMRIPSSSEFCTKLLAAFHKPIVSTSANISGQPSPKGLSDVDSAISEGVDYCVEAHCQGACTGQASQIIKIGLDCSVEIIRA